MVLALLSRRDRKKEQLKREILRAARELLLREGQQHFSMRELAKEVGCVPGTLYLYFKDKDALIATLVEDSFEHLMEDLEALRTDLNPLAFLRAIMRAYIRFGIANPNHYHFAFMLPRTKPLEKARPRPHRSYALLVDTVRECMDRQLIRKIDPDLAAQGVWSGIHGVTSLMITMPNFPWTDKATVIDHVVDSLTEGLHPLPKPDAGREGDTYES